MGEGLNFEEPIKENTAEGEWMINTKRVWRKELVIIHFYVYLKWHDNAPPRAVFYLTKPPVENMRNPSFTYC